MISIKYLGSKSRIAKYIVPILQKEIDDNNIDTFVDCFCGGCNIIDKIKCKRRIASDSNPYLIALLKHVSGGGKLPDEVSRELYNEAKDAWRRNDCSKFKVWELGTIGFLASYNGKFYTGGYGKPVYEKTKNGLRYRDYFREAKDNILKQAPNLVGIEFDTKDYHDYSGIENAVIYVDPPYSGTTGYANSADFDYDDFWRTMREWSKDNIVYISELSAPDDFECIWEQRVNRSVNATDKTWSVEKLFTFR